MVKRKRRKFTAELKAEAVRLCEVGDRTIGQVARDLDLTETALREWVKRAEVAGKGPPGALNRAERDELMQLRQENKRLLMEREILKKAAAFFAKERREARAEAPVVADSDTKSDRNAA